MSFAVLRAWTWRQLQSNGDTGSQAYKFGGITADEMEALFTTLCCVLPHLVDRELRELNTARMCENPPQAAVEDPLQAMIVACGRLLTWYQQCTTNQHNLSNDSVKPGKGSGSSAVPSRHVSNLQHIVETVGSPCPQGGSSGKRERGLWR